MKDPAKAAYRIQAEGNDSVKPPVDPRLMPNRSLHAALSNGIFHLHSEGGSQNEASEEERLWFDCVHKYLKEKFKVSLLAGIKEVQLRGFALTTDENSMPEFNFWGGKADAIGLLEGEDECKYVIVDWKNTRRKSNTFWEQCPPLPYRYYLTQCLVYARLLKMHLSLNYLPPILIVPFNSEKEYMRPRLFTDYPDECKEAIEKNPWLTNPPLRFKKGSLFKDSVKEGLLPGDTKVNEAFKEDATVDDLCKALKFCGILVKTEETTQE